MTNKNMTNYLQILINNLSHLCKLIPVNRLLNLRVCSQLKYFNCPIKYLTKRNHIFYFTAYDIKNINIIKNGILDNIIRCWQSNQLSMIFELFKRNPQIHNMYDDFTPFIDHLSHFPENKIIRQKYVLQKNIIDCLFGFQMDYSKNPHVKIKTPFYRDISELDSQCALILLLNSIKNYFNNLHVDRTKILKIEQNMSILKLYSKCEDIFLASFLCHTIRNSIVTGCEIVIDYYLKIYFDLIKLSDILLSFHNIYDLIYDIEINSTYIGKIFRYILQKSEIKNDSLLMQTQFIACIKKLTNVSIEIINIIIDFQLVNIENIEIKYLNNCIENNKVDLIDKLLKHNFSKNYLLNKVSQLSNNNNDLWDYLGFIKTDNQIIKTMILNYLTTL